MQCLRTRDLFITLIGWLLLAFSSGGFAGISYEASQINPGRWEYQYQVSNDSASSISEFSTFFDRSLYANLVVEGSPQDWDSIVLQPDPAIPSDGLFDALALGPELGIGESIGGFRVSFDYLGQGSPGSQRYSFLDAEFIEIASGATVASGSPSVPNQTIPEPSSLLLAIIGLAAVGARFRRIA